MRIITCFCACFFEKYFAVIFRSLLSGTAIRVYKGCSDVIDTHHSTVRFLVVQFHICFSLIVRNIVYCFIASI